MIASSRMTLGMFFGWMLLAGVLRAESPTGAQPSSARPSSPSSAVVTADAAPSSPPSAARRRPTELRAAVRAALRRESSSTGREQVAAIHDLLALYRDLAQPGRLERDERNQLRGTIRSRLTNVSRRISRQLAKNAVAKDAVAKDAVAKDAVAKAAAAQDTAPPDTVQHAKMPDDKSAVLAQQIGPAAAAGGVVAAAPGDSPDLMAALTELIRSVIAVGNWAEQPAARQVAGQQIVAQQVGPGQMAGPGMGPGGAAGLPKDLGADLIEIIQQTIAPDSWEVNGGQGTIVYFGPLQAIVVRQTDEVHDNLSGLIRDLRN